MTEKTAGNPIGYHLTPDRVLLDGVCRVEGCEHVAAEPHTAAVPALPPRLMEGQRYSVISYDALTRLAMMVTPNCGGDFRDQAWETVSIIRAILRQQGQPMAVTVQTVFIADAADVPAAQKLFEAYYGEEMPLTLFVVQPPCDGAALAIEAWAISTRTVEVGYFGPHLVTMEHGGLRWVYVSSGAIHQAGRSAYEQATEAFVELNKRLKPVGVPFHDVMRTWLYQGGITETEGDTERYRELNRGRTDFFDSVDFTANPLARQPSGHTAYPASTGIGTKEHGLVAEALAVQTDRDDVAILSLENPQQMSAFDYPAEYSKKSPKFSRAMSIRMGDHLTTWVSGTASIVKSKTVHVGDIEKQTEETLHNIEELISPENFANHGWPDAGAAMADLAEVRVYVKRLEDFEKCREVCERRLGLIPAIYTQADVCRPDLLVEIEGVAFSPVRAQG